MTQEHFYFEFKSLKSRKSYKSRKSGISWCNYNRNNAITNHILPSLGVLSPNANLEKDADYYFTLRQVYSDFTIYKVQKIKVVMPRGGSGGGGGGGPDPQEPKTSKRGENLARACKCGMF